jgi:DNA adenine methylase
MIGPLPYVGGKRRLAKTLIQLFPPHVTYVEPFCGGAQVFFHKSPSRVEVLNDLDGEIVNFLRVCREHPDELIRLLAFLVPSRAVFAQFAAQDPTHLTDIQRAVRFFYLQKNAFGGLIRRRTFHYCVAKPSNFRPGHLSTVVRETADRLCNVQIEHLPYEEILRRYDRSTTFFYLDPPYMGVHHYRFNFVEGDYDVLASRLSLLKGRFLLSLNDTPTVRAIFGRFTLRQCPVVYTSHQSVPLVQELVISNYAALDSESRGLSNHTK